MSTTADDEKIVCQIDNARVHMIVSHLREHHPDWTIERYKAEFPHAPLLSEKARNLVMKNKAKRLQEKDTEVAGVVRSRRPFAEVFGLEGVEVRNNRGETLEIDMHGDHSDAALAMIPDVDENYVFDIELAKTVLMAFGFRMPALFWGYHGTGKTSLLEQVCARIRRPFMRVQHTIGTEESHIVGQYVVKNGATEFQPGPLTIAMIEGFVYCADEYDFGMPAVLSVYQPVLEGKSLVIKDAPPEFRVVRPHENFRFVATGNTNGGGDETGLYQGTQIQNAANYSRFGVTREVGYMDPKIETLVLMRQAQIDKDSAGKLIKFAADVREAFKGGRIGTTISPRELINAGKLGRAKAGNWKEGMELAFVNRMNRVDREVITQFAQRVFG
jgi:cobaltochelatase CobS